MEMKKRGAFLRKKSLALLHKLGPRFCNHRPPSRLPEMRLELTLGYPKGILSPLRLPIPPLRLAGSHSCAITVGRDSVGRADGRCAGQKPHQRVTILRYYTSMSMGDEQELFTIALRIAIQAHQGQSDRAGQPYITHPMRMAARTPNPDERIVAILHDAVEDGFDNDVSFATLREAGFSDTILDAVDRLTRRRRETFPNLDSDEPYEKFVERCAGHPLSKAVKLLDLQDNMDITRLPEVTEGDLVRLNRYLRAWHRLGGDA